MATCSDVDSDLFNKSISDLGLNEWLVVQCKALHMTRPTSIQLQCIPEILKGGEMLRHRCFSHCNRTRASDGTTRSE